MRLRTRVFLFSFVPFVVILAFSFGMIQRLVQSTVREGLRSSLRENQLAIAHARSRSDLQNSRFLNVVGENPALKAGMQLVLAEPQSETARNTVEDQLRELCAHMDFDFFLVAAPDGAPIAGVMRKDGRFVPVSLSRLNSTRRGLVFVDGRTIQIASVSVDLAEENIGSLSVGEYFSLSEFAAPAVLVHDGRILESNIAGLPLADLNRSMAACLGQSECDVQLRGENYLSLPMQSDALGLGNTIRILQNVDAATGQLLAALRTLFLLVSLFAILIALVCSIASARAIVRPIGTMITSLRNSESTGLLPEFGKDASGILEISELTKSFNRAAVSIQEARDRLQSAYLEFVESLASALDARDRYTAGHSWRVSRLSCSTAEAMNLEREEIERIRIGALLHDIGKIGIADTVLQKPAALTAEEMGLVRQHPEIGRKILEGVHGFAPFLGAVEFHHENWNGTGYPRGQSGTQTPIDARIIHVTDAYDAMTSNRPYRPGMTPEQAIDILKINAGTQFDPHVVAAFANLRSAPASNTAVEPVEETALLIR